IHLLNVPVADAGRLADVVARLEAMTRLSRASWRSILAETDDAGLPPPREALQLSEAEAAIQGQEWIPNPRQHGALPGMRVTPTLVTGWMDLLDQFDGILAGRILIPHPRFMEGIN